MIATRSSGRQFSITISPVVIAPSPMKLAISMWSGPIVYSTPCSESEPWMCSTLVSMPSICAPSGTQEEAEILDVRLACGVTEHRLAFREYRCHDGVLRSRDARLVEEDALSDQTAGRHRELAVCVDLRAELLERMNVGVDAAPPDDVSAGRRDDRVAEACEQRACKQH